MRRAELEGLLPFAPRRFGVRGGVMSYVDAGAGDPVVLLHGNPTWSYLYRAFMRPLARSHRVVAPDHLGFGLSDKPLEAAWDLDWHIGNLTDLILGLDLQRITFVLHDWGGPIGLGFAVEHPARVERLLLMNTWAFRLPAGTPLPPLLEAVRDPVGGERLVLEHNVLVEQGLPAGVCGELGDEVMAAYRAPFEAPASRRAMLALVRDIPVGGQTATARRFLLIERRLRTLEVPVAILWGVRDPVFPAAMLRLWQHHRPDADVERLEGASHFLQEDKPEEIVAWVSRHLL